VQKNNEKVELSSILYWSEESSDPVPQIKGNSILSFDPLKLDQKSIIMQVVFRSHYAPERKT